MAPTNRDLSFFFGGVTGPKNVTEDLLHTDVFNLCTVEKKVQFVPGNCNNLSRFKTFIGYDPLFRLASLWL